MQNSIRRGANLYKVDLLLLQQALLLQGAGEHLDLLQHRLGADHLHIIILHLLRCCNTGECFSKGTDEQCKDGRTQDWPATGVTC